MSLKKDVQEQIEWAIDTLKAIKEPNINVRGTLIKGEQFLAEFKLVPETEFNKILQVIQPVRKDSEATDEEKMNINDIEVVDPEELIFKDPPLDVEFDLTYEETADDTTDIGINKDDSDG